MEKKMSKKKIVGLCIVGFIILAMLVGGIGYVAGWFDNGYTADVVTVSTRDITATFDTSGLVSAKKEGNFTMVSGIKVEKVNVEVGSIVKKGDVLAEFNTASLNSTLAEKKSAVDKAQKAYSDYEKSVSQAKGQLSSLNSQIAQAESKVAQLEKQSQQEQQKAKLNEQQQSQAKEAEDKLTSIIDDSSLAGKIINNIINSSESLKDLKSMLEMMSSMSESSSSLSQMYSMMGASGSSSAQLELVQAQLELAMLKVSKTTNETQAQGSLTSVYKSVYESAKEAYESTKATIDSLNAGWVAENAGVVSEVNITAGQTFASKNSSADSSFDVSSIVNAVVSGGDVTQLISGFFSSDETGIKVQYYPLEISFMLKKGDLSKVSLGQKVVVKSSTDKEINGEVSFIAAVATASSGVDLNSLLGTSSGGSGGIEARVTVDEPDGGIIIGLDADVSIATEEKKNCITVPVEAIQYDGDHAYVFVYDKNEKTVSKTPVETGILDGSYYEITSGIKEGDIIIKTPGTTMKDADKVIAHNVDNK